MEQSSVTTWPGHHSPVQPAHGETETCKHAQVETHRVWGVEAQARGCYRQGLLSDAPSPATPQVGNATPRHPLVRIGARSTTTAREWVRVSTSAQKYRMCMEWATDRDKPNLIALGVSRQERRVADWSGARHDPGKVLAVSVGRDLCGVALGPLRGRGDIDMEKSRSDISSPQHCCASFSRKP